MAGAQAVGASVATADDDGVFAVGQDVELRIELVSRTALILLREEFHREVNALQLTPGNVQIAGMLGTASQKNNVEFALQVLDGNAVPHVSLGDKLHALGRHLPDAAVDHLLLHLELRNAVAQ